VTKVLLTKDHDMIEAGLQVMGRLSLEAIDPNGRGDPVLYRIRACAQGPR